MKELIINSDQQKRYALSVIEQMKPDGAYTVIVKKTDMNPTAKQRRLHWMWCQEVAVSGLGAHDVKEDVYIYSKWKFARPVLLRDSESFNIIYHHFMKTIKGSAMQSEMTKEFADQYISIENMTRAQRCEVMREFQGYWIRKGVCLTEPSLQGVDLNKY